MDSPAASTTILLSEPLPLSFPSILINPKLKHLSSQLPKNHHRPQKTDPSSADTRPIGKRRLQRVANAQFSSNPHVSRPTSRDYQLWTADPQVKFPTPPPRGYPSSLYIPPAEPIPLDPFSATMGAFNRSLKGVRKNIQRLVGAHPSVEGGPGPVEEILLKIDEQLARWIDSHTVWKTTETDYSRTIVEPTPWPSPAPLRDKPLSEPCSEPSIVEISRSPHMLNWEVRNPFGRYLVHCVARYYGIVSFSRPAASPASEPALPGSQRTVVCMVKAHFPTQRGSRIDGNQSLDTPPTTDLDSELSAPEVLSEDSGALTDGALTDDERPPPHTIPRPSLPPVLPTSIRVDQPAKLLSNHPGLSDPEAADHSSLDSFGEDNDEDERESTASSARDENRAEWTSLGDQQDPNQTITAHSLSCIVQPTPALLHTSATNSPIKNPIPTTTASPLKSSSVKLCIDRPRLGFLEWVRS
ncbi:hypothetical protein PtA15_1A752 [Puccinia triticina]|uniref:R3H-associated N-terminal domain-containing protein n=1 Tax=Puccinia triticina TaxID=208348 RepID=A0ABY7C8B1_9BASI|nr:uncharacterized protein PtA15_1A752 [Puccinia triticina]WAQ81411.1 hypothetical protein PtA15_1A752 [Puccinia triticina]